jgi:signal transduction histidine kinase
MTRTPTSSRRERFVLALGLVSALALAAAAFAPLSDPDSAGRAQLAQIASRTADGVAAEWALARREEAPLCTPASDTLSWTRAFALAKPAEIAPSSANAGEIDSTVFDALMSESERTEIAKHDVAEAAALASDALTKPADPARKAQGLLRSIQLEGALGHDELVAARWSEVRRDVSPRIASGGTSVVLLAAIAARAHLAAAARAELCDWIEAAWTNGELVLPGSDSIFVRRESASGVRYEPAIDGRAGELRERLLAACGTSPELRAAFSHRDEVELAGALRRTLGALPADATATEWSLTPFGDDFFAAREGPNGTLRGHFLARVALGANLARRASEHGLLAEGLALDFSGDRTDLGPVVRPRTDLVGGAFGFALRHADPEGFVKRIGRRAMWLRAGFALMSAFAAIAALATFRALRRERKLAEARTAFVANVSHELRTPLASILLMAENLAGDRVGSRENEARYHASIRREALRLRRLVDDVLDFSRLERGKRFDLRVEETDVREWFDGLCDDLRAFAVQPGAEIATSSGAVPPSAAFDREALRRAVFNLVDNALRHSGTKSVEVRLEQRDGDLVISVSDAGRGIPPNRRREVFEPFTRLVESNGTPGAGLGLAIVREIVEAHGGSIAVRDRDAGPGVTFEMRIPLATQPASATKESPR